MSTIIKPNCFYKYQSCKDVNSLTNLNSERLFLSEPKSFSDSFDCVLRLMSDYPDRFNLTKEQFKSLVDSDRSDDVFELVNDFLLKRSKNIICYCVSKEPNNHILWDRYGDGLAGFCLGFASSAVFFNEAYHVEYKLELPSVEDIYSKVYEVLVSLSPQSSLDPQAPLLQELHQLSVCTKLTYYDQEKEWRVTHYRNDSEFISNSHCCPINKAGLTSIIIGEKMSAQDRDLLQTIIKQKYQNPPIQLKIARVSANSTIIIEPFSFD